MDPPEGHKKEGRGRWRLRHLEELRNVLHTLHVRSPGPLLQTALLQGGKLKATARLNAVAAGTLVHVQCQLLNRRYLVDTGATFNLLPHKSHHPPVQQPRLIGPNGQPIRCWGEERLRLQFSSRTFWWTFLKADVTFPILGVDFLRSNRLSVSVATNQLVDDANGDTFCLTEQPSGHTASVMLPASVREESSKPARPMAAPPRKGPRGTYATAVNRNIPPRQPPRGTPQRPSGDRRPKPPLRRHSNRRRRPSEKGRAVRQHPAPSRSCLRNTRTQAAT
jgi:hypothetical protein